MADVPVEAIGKAERTTPLLVIRCSVPGFLHLHSTEGLPDGQKEPLCSSLLPEPQSQALGTTEHPQVYMDMYGIFLRLLGADQFQIS